MHFLQTAGMERTAPTLHTLELKPIEIRKYGKLYCQIPGNSFVFWPDHEGAFIVSSGILSGEGNELQKAGRLVQNAV